MGKQIVVETCYISGFMGITKIQNNKSDLQPHSWSLAIILFCRPYM